MKSSKDTPRRHKKRCTEDELRLDIRTAFEWSNRISKLYYKDERDKATPEQAGSWECAAEYCNLLLYIAEKILHVKPLTRADLKAIVKACNKLRRNARPYSRALRAFGMSEDNELWPEKILFDAPINEVPAAGAMISEPPTGQTTSASKQYTNPLESLSVYKDIIAEILYVHGWNTKALFVAEKIDITDRRVFNALPPGFRDKVDDSMTMLSQLIKKYPLFRKRFENTVSEVRRILKKRNIGKP